MGGNTLTEGNTLVCWTCVGTCLYVTRHFQVQYQTFLGKFQVQYQVYVAWYTAQHFYVIFPKYISRE